MLKLFQNTIVCLVIKVTFQGWDTQDELALLAAHLHKCSFA